MVPWPVSTVELRITVMVRNDGAIRGAYGYGIKKKLLSHILHIGRYGLVAQIERDCQAPT